MFAECVLAYHIGQRDSLTYKIPAVLASKIALGSIVLVPLRARRVAAVVTGISEHTHLDNVKDIIDHVDDLGHDYLEFIKTVSDYYLSPVAVTLRSALPDIPVRKRKAGSKAQRKSGSQFETEIRFNSDNQDIIIEANNTKAGQVMIIAPTKERADDLYKLYGEEAGLITSGVSMGGYFKIWQEFKDGALKTLIATRIGIFIPSADLAKIIVVDEESGLYKERQTPKYHLADVAIMLAKIKKCKIVLYSIAPRLKTVYEQKPKMPAPKKNLKRLEIVRLAPNELLSGTLKHAVSDALENKEKILLFHNRLGKARLLMSQCGHVEKCKNCSVALVLHKKEGRDVLVCHQCNFRALRPAKCEKCGKSNYVQYGYGIQKIEEVINAQFRNAKAGIFKSGEMPDGSLDIIISTSAILNQLSRYTGHFGLVALTWADSYYYLPDYAAHENLFTTIIKLDELTNEKGKMILQSTIDREDTFRLAATQSYEEFYTRELAERKKYGLPPITSQIYIKFEHKDPSIVVKNLTELKKILEIYAVIKGPTPGYIPKVRGKTVGYITLHIKDGLTQPARKVIAGLRRPFSVDRDPIGVI